MRKTLAFCLVLSAFFLCSCESTVMPDPSVNIKYPVPLRAKVKLTVENSYNTHIKTLVDGIYEAGIYNVQFDANNLAEGIYFYTLEIKGKDYYSKITKHLLLRKQ